MAADDDDDATTGSTPTEAHRSRPVRRWRRSARPGRSRSAPSSTSRCSGSRASDGKPVGFDVEIAKIIAARARHRPRTSIDWVETVSADPRGVHRAGQGRHRRRDLHDQRHAQGAIVDFAGPYYVAGQDIMVHGGQHRHHRTGLLQAGKKVCSVTGSTPAKRDHGQLPDRPDRCSLFDAYSQVRRGAAQRAGRRGDHRQRHPARASSTRTRASSRSSASRSPRSRTASASRRTTPTFRDVHQRRAGGVLRGRPLGGGLGEHRRRRHSGCRTRRRSTATETRVRNRVDHGAVPHPGRPPWDFSMIDATSPNSR